LARRNHFSPHTGRKTDIKQILCDVPILALLSHLLTGKSFVAQQSHSKRILFHLPALSEMLIEGSLYLGTRATEVSPALRADDLKAAARRKERR
jgi:hypothetical protein